jgi:hypothetical protein
MSFKALKNLLGPGLIRHWLGNKINNHLRMLSLLPASHSAPEKARNKGLMIFKALDELKYEILTKEGAEKTVAATKTQKRILTYRYKDIVITQLKK